METSCVICWQSHLLHAHRQHRYQRYNISTTGRYETRGAICGRIVKPVARILMALAVMRRAASYATISPEMRISATVVLKFSAGS